MKFSIIIPAYNAGATIGRALESIQQQKFTDYEVIVVDDGSDEDFDIPNTGMNGVLVYQPNQGVGAARNRGLMNAKGEYVLFLDADDELTKDALQIFANVVDGYDAVYGGICEVGFGYTTDRSAKDMGSACGVAYRREFLRENNIWFPEIPQMEDVAFNQIVECCGARIFNDPQMEAYVYDVGGDRQCKKRYKITALPWIVAANTYVWGRLIGRDINLAYTQTVRQIGFIYWYLMGAIKDMRQDEYVQVWGRLKEWNLATGTLRIIETVKPFTDFFAQCDAGNRRSAEKILGKATPVMTQKEFFEQILGRAWNPSA